MSLPHPQETRALSSESPNELATRGWTDRSGLFVSLALAWLAVSGIWIWLAPFSIATQLQVLAHTVLGLLLLGPYAVFQVRHLRVWWRQRLTVVMSLGYLLMAMVVVCCMSGLVLTWQAALGPRRTQPWAVLHLVSGVGAGALLPLHLALAWIRRALPQGGADALGSARRRFARASIAWSLLASVAFGAASYLMPRPAVEFPVPADYTLQDYALQHEEYLGSPFAPSYARTASGAFVDPSALAGSASCGTSGCHEQILAEWEPSAHRFAAMNPPFQAVQRLFADDRGAAETRYCAGCHDPISLFAGAKDIHVQDLSAPGMQEGISCVACHSIALVDQRGNADYVLVPPQRYLWEGEPGWRKRVSDFLIRSLPRQHLADYDRNLLRRPEFCGACHKQFIPEALNRFGSTPGQNQYDEWRQSHWHSDDPLTDLACRDCHMRLVHDSRDPGHGEAGDLRRDPRDGKHRHHGFIATNLFMPAVLDLPHAAEHIRLTEEWIRGETVIPEIAELWPEGPVAEVELRSPEAVTPGTELQLQVVVHNRKAGHGFTTGPLDFMQAWVHLVVEDAAGERLGEWGALDPHTRRLLDAPGVEHRAGNARDAGTLVLEGMPLDRHGQVLERHQLWDKAGGLGQRQIYAGHSDQQTYRVHVPQSAAFPLTARAELRFRRYRQDFLELVLPDLERESGVIQPALTKSADQVLVQRGAERGPGGSGAAPAAGGPGR